MSIMKGLLNMTLCELIGADLNMKIVSVAAAALVPDSSTSTTALCTICRRQQVSPSHQGLGDAIPGDSRVSACGMPVQVSAQLRHQAGGK